MAPIFRVSVNNADLTKGIGPGLITAEDEEAAKVEFALQEGSTIETLTEQGYTWWSVSRKGSED